MMEDFFEVAGVVSDTINGELDDNSDDFVLFLIELGMDLDITQKGLLSGFYSGYMAAKERFCK